MMVDEFEQQDENTAMTTLTVGRGNYFLLPDSMMSPTGLIEHIAQSCSALAASRKEHTDSVPVGMIAEVKNFCCHRRPQLNEQLTTTVMFGFSFGSMTLAHGISKIGEETVAEVDLKIFMQ
jgi:predicted hotdog family 3-hydroxylacyl-ACP dehydratase